MKKKRIFGIMLAMVMIMSVLPISIAFAAEYGGGSGTASDPYQISTLEHFEAFRDAVNNGSLSVCAKLMNDIDMIGVYGANVNGAEKSWTPIGNTSDKSFCGTFDGNGHTVKNIYVNSKDAGLFGYIGKKGETKGTVKNLSTAGEVIGKADEYDYCYAGGIVNENYGTIEGCTNYCTVKADEGSVDTEYLGGIVSSNFGTVKGCTNAGTLQGRSGIYNSYLGGIAAAIYGGTIENCLNAGDIKPGSISNGLVAGGIVGYVSNNNKCDITSCLNVKGLDKNAGIGDWIGGIVGFTNKSINISSYAITCTNSYYLESDGYYGIGDSDEDSEDHNIKAVTVVQLKTGEVARALQNGQTAQAWGQSLSGTKDVNPILTSDVEKKVNKITFIKENNNSNANKEETVKYANKKIAKSDLPAIGDNSDYAFWWSKDKTRTVFDENTEITEDTTVYAMMGEKTEASDKSDTITLNKNTEITTPIDLNDYVKNKSGKEKNFAFYLEDEATLPEGLKFDGNTGKIIGTPTTLGTYTVKFNVANNSISLLSLETNDSGVDVLTLTFEVDLEKDKDGAYLIGEVGDLEYFRDKVNDGAYKSANAKLMNDIDMSGIENYVPIGGTTGLYYSAEDTDKGYSGVFDGNGHVVKNLTVKGSSTAELTYGVFGTLSGTVKNLGVDNFKFEVGSKDCRAGAVVGQILSGGNVTDCYASNVNITATSKVAGGIAGCNYSGSISDCIAYKVTITASRHGGIVGDNRGDVSADDRKGTVTNCFTDYSNINYNQNNGNVENCESELLLYDFSSGRIAYLLNNKSENGIWKQNLENNEDIYPSFSGGTVYGTTGCETYSNTKSDGEKAHNYVDGLCKNCGDYADSQPTLKDGAYEISSAGELMWFADKVNSGDCAINAKLTKDIDVSSAKRINIGKTQSKAYKGTFDGDGHTISNLCITTMDSNCGLFGVVEGGTVKNFTIKGNIVISTLGTDGSSCVTSVGGAVGVAKGKSTIENVISYVNINDKGKNANFENKYICGIVGTLSNSVVKKCEYYGTIEMQSSQVTAGIGALCTDSSEISECTNYGTIKSIGNSKHIGGVVADAQSETVVLKCINKGDVTSGGADCIGGIVAYAQNIKIENCGNIGTIKTTADGHGFIGGILGYINSDKFKGIHNCYNYGNIVTNDGCGDLAGAIVGWNRNSGNVYGNNYYLKTSCGSAYGKSGNSITATAKEKNAFENGEIAYLLGSAWGQDLENEAYPIPNGKTVYKYGRLYSNNEPNIFKIWDVETSENETKVTVSVPTVGTYTIVLVKYTDNGKKLSQTETITVTTTKENQIVTDSKNIVLSKGDKVMLWDNFSNLTPKCEVYEVK